MMKLRLSLDLHDEMNILTNLILTKDFSTFSANNWDVYFQKPASPIMYGIIDLHDFIMVYLVFIVFFVTFMLLIILKESTISEHDSFNKFKRVKSLYNVEFSHHTLLETIWIIVPSIILLTIAIPSFIILYAMDIIPHHDFTIKVIGHQWYWSYEYVMENLFLLKTSIFKSNNDLSSCEKEVLHRYTFDSYMIPSDELKPSQTRLLETTNPLVIPIARYASVTVTSTDVIHSFAVPSLGIKIDAIPGRLNTISLYIMELGHFYGQCSELCGVNHGFMPIEIYCVDMVGFSIYKAALLSKIVAKEDITGKAIHGVLQGKLLLQFDKWLLTCYANRLDQQIKFRYTKMLSKKKTTTNLPPICSVLETTKIKIPFIPTNFNIFNPLYQKINTFDNLKLFLNKPLFILQKDDKCFDLWFLNKIISASNLNNSTLNSKQFNLISEDNSTFFNKKEELSNKGFIGYLLNKKII